MTNETTRPGLYIHVPFCLQKCRYCDFYSTSRIEILPVFIEALLKEIEVRRQEVHAPDTLYLGGGTPSLLTPAQIRRILAAVTQHFDLSPDAEITLEANPGTVTLETLKAFKDAGINRLSIGVQSFSDENLRFLGRIHSAAHARRTLSHARAAGFTNIGIDLIYALPGQTAADFKKELEAAVFHAPEHISSYMLTYEPGTPLFKEREIGKCRPLSDETAAALYLDLVAFLSAHGYEQYEISNFAKNAPGEPADRRSRHNLKYWQGAPYLGFGPSAHSFMGNARWWNHPDTTSYASALSCGDLPVSGQESLTLEQLAMEAIYLGMRQTRGLDLEAFERLYEGMMGKNYRDAIDEMADAGWVTLTRHRVALTVEGMLRLDAICGKLAAMIETQRRPDRK